MHTQGKINNKIENAQKLFDKLSTFTIDRIQLINI